MVGVRTPQMIKIIWFLLNVWNHQFVPGSRKSKVVASWSPCWSIPYGLCYSSHFFLFLTMSCWSYLHFFSCVALENPGWNINGNQIENWPYHDYFFSTWSTQARLPCGHLHWAMGFWLAIPPTQSTFAPYHATNIQIVIKNFEHPPNKIKVLKNYWKHLKTTSKPTE